MFIHCGLMQVKTALWLTPKMKAVKNRPLLEKKYDR